MDRAFVGDFYGIDPCGARTFAQARMQSGQLIAGTLRQDLDAAIVIITDPSGDAEDVGLAFDKPTETDALDASAN